MLLLWQSHMIYILFYHNDTHEEASPSFPRAVKGGGAAKSRPSASLRQKTIKKLPTQAGRCVRLSLEHLTLWEGLHTASNDPGWCNQSKTHFHYHLWCTQSKKSQYHQNSDWGMKPEALELSFSAERKKKKLQGFKLSSRVTSAGLKMYNSPSGLELKHYSPTCYLLNL